MIRPVVRRIIPAAPAKRHLQTGFTLLEIMVAMVVLTLIVTSAFGALRLGERSWEAGLTRANETETLRTVARVLQSQFRQALPLSWTIDAEKKIAFTGTPEQIRFIAPAPQHDGSTGLFEYTLVVEPHDEHVSLVLFYRLHDPDIDGFQALGDDSQRVLLVETLASAAFAYYGSPTSKDVPRWHSQWNSDAESFPRQVQVRLAAQNEQRQWPDLFLSLPTDVAQ